MLAVASVKLVSVTYFNRRLVRINLGHELNSEQRVFAGWLVGDRGVSTTYLDCFSSVYVR